MENNEKKLGLDYAFPNGMEINNEYGMSKRFYAACAVMQGMCADTDVRLDAKGLIANVKLSYRIADELLKQENK
jgi:hypothetical protein